MRLLWTALVFWLTAVPNITLSQERIVLDEQRWHEYARYVQSFTTIQLSENGEWRIATKFSNGHRTLRQHMTATLVVLSEDGECLFGAHHEEDVGPSFGGSASEKNDLTTGRIPPSAIGFVDSIEFRAGGLTSEIIGRFNDLRPYGQSLPTDDGGSFCNPHAEFPEAGSTAPVVTYILH